MMERIKTKDTVVVISGKEKGKTGAVFDISHKKDAVKVKNVMLVTKHQKPRGMGMSSGIMQKEAWISLSKVMPNCTSCNKATRVKAKVLDSGESVRVCGRCLENF
jgi:large subunit ribosomal protein L24